MWATGFYDMANMKRDRYIVRIGRVILVLDS